MGCSAPRLMFLPSVNDSRCIDARSGEEMSPLLKGFSGFSSLRDECFAVFCRHVCASAEVSASAWPGWGVPLKTGPAPWIEPSLFPPWGSWLRRSSPGPPSHRCWSLRTLRAVSHPPHPQPSKFALKMKPTERGGQVLPFLSVMAQVLSTHNFRTNSRG